ncbi:response regulator transcription factor [Parendozoicomonas haliclonae]|uniref:Bacterial regulatory protein, luxR family n=1 Tax=Parendozoicomonas haliclonae TaxID=1960125 RepID=A0A1X7ARS0_9GAMM|nr:helix-turn-helix transcriptional regulator [Parendozoicomonas haliclonae]SMA50843.1 Bacterial regulatory protein, luxR family [Parendozoicomonas haliclonae]
MSAAVNNHLISQTLSTKRSLNDIKAALMADLEPMGFHAFTYEGIPFRVIDDIHAPSESRLFKLSHIAKAKTSLSSCEEEFQLHKAFLSHLREGDLTPRRDQIFSQPVFYFLENLEVARAHGDTNFNSSISLPITAFCSSEWGTMFSLKSWRKETDMQRWYADKQHELCSLLFSYHLEFMLFYRELFNPYLQMGVFSQKTLKILRMAADGYTGKRICDQLCMSERGVDYHFELLRQKLQAKNRLHLIKIAEQLQIT